VTETTTRAATLRERQAPLKARYEADPESAKLTIVVRSATAGDDPMRSRIVLEAVPGVAWDAAAHPYAGGDGDLACSGDLLLGSLAACQEITLRMVATAMGIALKEVEVVVEGDMDFRGTMGIDRETPVGFQAIRTKVRVVPEGDVPADRLERLAQRAERFCVVASTLRQSPSMELSFVTGEG
jgi:uncharacterized OsmC-like protein